MPKELAVPSYLSGNKYPGRVLTDLRGKMFGKLRVEGYSHSEKGRSFWSAACTCGTRIVVSRTTLTQRKRTACCRSCMYKNFTGVQVGHIRVISQVPTPTGQTGQRWSCVCTKCHATSVRSSGHLRERAGCECSVRHTPGDAARKALFNRYRLSAVRRSLPFLLTEEQCDSLFQSRCRFCGCAPEQRCVTGNSVYTYNGIDRADPKQGYTTDNVGPCCKTCNLRKGKMTVEEFTKWITVVYRNFQ